MPRRSVAIAVEPPLLQSVLEQILTARGWEMEHVSATATMSTAAIMSAGCEIDPASVGAGVVVTLPDEGGIGGSIFFPAEGRSEAFPGNRQVLGLILDLLERARDP